MTKTMLERAARALAETDERSYRRLNMYGVHRERYLTLARAVLMAVREPNEAMSQAVRTTEGWEDMIDAILNEPHR